MPLPFPGSQDSSSRLKRRLTLAFSTMTLENPGTMAPFPWLPMLAISTGLISHSYCLTSLFPYVGYMVQQMGVTDDKDASGFYAGFIASAFMVGRFSSSYFWGRFSDQYGRLPVLFVGLWAMAILSIGFGMSTNFYWALTCRFLLGAFNGIVATSKTMISEVCSSEHEVVGMSFVTATWSIGFIIGPGLGGLLAEPATHYPRFFHEEGIFGRFPYFLPNLVGAGLALVALPLTYVFLHETHPAHAARDKTRTRRGFKLVSMSEGAMDSADAAERGRLEAVSLERYNSISNDRSISSEALAEYNKTVSRSSLKRGKGSDASVSSVTSVTFATETTSITDDDDVDDDDSPRASTVRTCFVDDESDEGTHDYTDESPRARYSRGRSEANNFGEPSSPTDQSWSSRETGSESGAKMFSCQRECLSPALMLTEKRIRVLMIVYGIYSFINIGFQEVYPLWALSTVANGGLDWTTKDIGQVLSLVGVIMMLFQTCVYPILLKKMGTRRVQHWASIVATPLYFTVPMLAHLRENKVALIVSTVVVIFTANSCGNAIFVTVAVATNNAVEPERRGELNGLAMMVGSLAKAAGPFFFSVIFAWSISTSDRPFPFGPHLAYLIVSLGMLAVAIIGWNITDYEEENSAGGESSVKPQKGVPKEESKTDLMAA